MVCCTDVEGCGVETVTGGKKEKEMLELHPSAWKRTSHEDLAQACGVEHVLTHDAFTQLLRLSLR